MLQNSDITFNYPEELPVSAHRDEILAALSAYDVIIVSGDTGSGKTTQLPKMALEHMLSRLPADAPSDFNEKLPPLSNAKLPRIVCTQPRRLAAVTMAERVAHELQTPVGGIVGFQHRYSRQLSRETQIKFATDGVLLSETRSDPLLRSYDVIIIDEAHERSLNVDFLLGIIKRILARRHDLKIIVSSATLDVERFSKFFGSAPIISIPGRLFPIEYVYLPPSEDDEADLPRDVSKAVDVLPAKHDTLVFLPGERDIRETADELRRFHANDDIIPLLASLPASEQRRAFAPSSRRKIILATNVAETSVTIPGIRCVIDSGLARISRYVHRTQIQRLQVESVSKASSRQRAGRCGRLGPGTCVRLYSEEDFNSRDDFTPPEVLRSSLAGVILTMLDLRLGSVENFPFIDPPKPAMIHEGLRELLELGAICHDKRGDVALTEIGRKLARIPVEPRLARMLLSASSRAVLPSVLPVVAALSCDDPRRRPIDEREKAAQAHAQFRVDGSDFLCTLRLWNIWQSETSDLSQSKARALAKKLYLSYPKMREWRDLTRQLTELSKRLGLSFQEDFTPELSREEPDDKVFKDWSARFHQSLLSGLLGRVGKYNAEEREYRGAHGIRFSLHPASVLSKKVKSRQHHHPREVEQKVRTPEWIFAGELVDTARLFAREAAILDPSWIEPVARGICKHSYHSPEWDEHSGFVRATEQVTLYGLVIVPARRCDYSRINLVHAREIFIRRALVDCDFMRPPPQLRQNKTLLDALRSHAEKTRHPEYFDAERLCAHFDKVLPPDVASAPAFVRWLRSGHNTAAFILRKSDWWPAENVNDRDFPDTLMIGGKKMRLTYLNAPDNPEIDGITCTVRKCDAPALRLWRADWLVPGALPAKLQFFISALPSAQRRILQPMDDVMTILLSTLKPGSEPLTENLRKTIYEQWGIRIASDAWKNARIPPHMMVRFRITGDDGVELAASRDLDEALALAGVHAERTIAAKNVASENKEITSLEIWPYGTIPEKKTDTLSGWKLEHFPALRDEGDKGVTLHLFADAKSAAAAHSTAVTKLFLRAIGVSSRVLFRRKQLPIAVQMYLKELNYDDEQIAQDILEGSVRETFVRNQPPVRDGDEFKRRLAELRLHLAEVQLEMSKIIADSFAAAARIDEALSGWRISSETSDSVQTQLAWLLYRGFPRNVPLKRLRHYKRYLKGAEIRIERARMNPAGDISKEERLSPYWILYEEAVTGKSKVKFDAEALVEIRWMIEELRVSLFAQELKTAEPVSAKRLDDKFAAAVCL